MANCVALTGGRRAAGRTLERRPALAREPSCAVAYVERIHGGYRWVFSQGQAGAKQGERERPDAVRKNG